MNTKIIDNWFTYHKPTEDQIESYSELREMAKVMAQAIDLLVPDGADKSAALRKLRECVMTANAGIACHMEPWEEDPDIRDPEPVV